MLVGFLQVINEMKVKWLKLVITLGIVIVVGWFILHKKKEPTAKVPKDNYILLNKADIVNAKLGTVDDVVAFTGDLAPLNQAVISAEVDAEVKKVLVNEGQLVKKNQVLAVLDDADLVQALGEQKAQLVSVQAKFNLDKQKLDRQKELYEQGFISKMGYDELIANYKVSQEAILQQQASLQRAQKQLSNTIIKAPFSGYIYQKNIDVGQLASKNGKLFSLANLDIMQIKAPIPSDQINEIKINQVVTFKVETSDQPYEGKITHINPVAEAGTRSYMVYIDFDNTKYRLKAGQFVKGQVLLKSMHNVISIPTDSLRSSESSNFVLTLNNNTIVKKSVKLLIQNQLSDLSGVSGLDNDDKVLAGSVLTVKPGDKAKVLD